MMGIYLSLSKEKKLDEDLSLSVLNTSLSFNFNVRIDNEWQKISTQYHLIWLNICVFINIFIFSWTFPCYAIMLKHCCIKYADFAKKI